MRKKIVFCVAAALICAPAAARDFNGVGRHGAGVSPHGKSHRSGAWIGDNRHRHGVPHDGRWSGGHDHFSPRGQGGHHWGW